MSWADKDFEENIHQYINEIYERNFNNIKSIYRFDRDNKNKTLDILDKDLGIDSIIVFKNGSIISFQEKTRRFENIQYNDFTFEYYNNPLTKEKGEWFKLLAQFYFYGYMNKKENKYLKYFIINISILRLAINTISLKVLTEKIKQNNLHGKANFITIPFEWIIELNKKHKGLIYTYYDTNN